MYIYITYDSDGYLIDLSITEKEGYTKVYANADWSKQMLKYTSKFRYDVNSGHILNPGNLPENNIDDVAKSVSSLSNDMGRVTDSVTEVALVASKGLMGSSQAQMALTQISQQLTALYATVASISASEPVKSAPTLSSIDTTGTSASVSLN